VSGIDQGIPCPTYLDVPQGQLAANCIAEAFHCIAWRAMKYVSCRPVSTPTDKAFDIAEQDANIKQCQRAETLQNQTVAHGKI
jgi:hypothetical protein